MRTLALVITAFALACPRAAAQLDAAVIERVKAATALVKVVTYRTWGTGSGFLIARRGTLGYIVTNHHVAQMPRVRDARLKVVLRSGTTREQVLAATLLASDAKHDLAVLRIEARDLPEPIALAASTQLREVLPCYLFGFPFGEQLRTSGRRHPAITVSKGAVSSIRKDDQQRVALVQIDTSINPGNSGGPVVDAKGALIGVATAKIGGTQIGFAVPPRHVRALLRPRVRALKARQLSNVKGVARLRFEVDLVDPLGAISKTTVLWIRHDKSGPIAAAGGRPKRLGGAIQRTPCTRSGAGAKGELTLTSPGRETVRYLVQVEAVLDGGKLLYTAPTPVDVDFAAGYASAPSRTTGGSVSGASVASRVKQMLAKAGPLAQPARKLCADDIVEARLAYGGAYLVVQLKGGKLAVFDILGLRFVKYFKMPDTESIWATGGNKLVVLSKANGVVETYDLTTLTRKSARKMSAKKPLLAIVMGLNNSKKAFVAWKEQAKLLGRMRTVERLGLMNVSNGRLTALEPARGHGMFRTPTMSERPTLRSDGKLSQITAWRATGVSPQGVWHMSIQGTKMSASYEHSSEGYIAPSLDGRFFCTGNGGLFKFRIDNPVRRERGSVVLPVHGTRYYLAINRRSSHRRGQGAPEAELKLRSSFATVRRIALPCSTIYTWGGRRGLSIDHQLWAVGATGRLVQIDARNRTIHVAPLGLPGGASGRAAAPGKGLALRGKTWTSKLSFPAGTKVVVEDGPRGVRFDAATMSLRWAVPAAQAAGAHEILLSVTPPGEEERYERVPVEVR